MELKWDGLLLVLKEKAGEIVAFEEGVDIVCAVRKVGNINTGIAIDTVHIPTETERIRICEKLRDQVTEHAGDGIIIVRAFVPILRINER